MVGEGPVGGFGVGIGGGASIPGPSGMGANPASIIDELTKGAGDRMALAAAAATPIPGGHVLQTPASLAPQAPSVYKPTQSSTGAVVGRHNAKVRGIGATITGALNAIGEVTTAEGNKKKLQLATDTQSLLTAQAGVDQAQEILKQNPNDPDASKQLEHNKKVMAGLLSDDKFAKAVGKGFHIDFTDPKKNDSPEHAGVAQGIQMHKTAEQLKEDKDAAGVSRAGQFSGGVPQQSMQNPQAIARYQEAQLQQKASAETLKALSPIIAAQTRAGAQLGAAQIREQGEAFKAAYMSQQRAIAQADRFQQAEKLLGIKYSNESKLIAQRGATALRTAEGIMDLKDKDPLNIMTKFTTAFSGLQRASGDIQSQISKLQNDIQNPNNKDPKRLDDMSKEIEALKVQKSNLDSAAMDTKKFGDSLILKGANDGAGASSVNDSKPSDDNDDPEDEDSLTFDHFLE